MLQQPVHQFGSRIFQLLGLRCRIARQQHLRLDVNQHGGHVDKIGRHIHVQLANLFHVGEILLGDAGNRNIVDVNILLANQIKQQVQRTFVYVGHRDRKRRIALFFFLLRRRNQHRSKQFRFARRSHHVFFHATSHHSPPEARTQATFPSPRAPLPWCGPPLCAPVPSLSQEYPKPAEDSPRISCGAPASASATARARRQPTPCTRCTRCRLTGSQRPPSPSSLCC